MIGREDERRFRPDAGLSQASSPPPPAPVCAVPSQEPVHADSAKDLVRPFTSVICRPQFPAGQQFGVDRRDLRQHRLGLLAPAQVAAHHPGQRGGHVPRPAAAGRARGEVGIRAVRRAGPRTGSRAGRTGAPARSARRPAPVPRRRAGLPPHGGGPAAGGWTAPGDRSCVHSSTRECREKEFRSTTAKRTSQRAELGQALSRQPARQRRLTPVGPRLRQRYLAADTAGADEHGVCPAALHIQDLEPLPVQRMKRMGDNYETRRVTGRRGTCHAPLRVAVGL